MSKLRKPKELPCKICGETVKNVGEQATHVTCWKCVNEIMKTKPIEDHIEKQITNN